MSMFRTLSMIGTVTNHAGIYLRVECHEHPYYILPGDTLGAKIGDIVELGNGPFGRNDYNFKVIKVFDKQEGEKALYDLFRREYN